MLPFFGTHRAPMSASAVWSRVVLALALVVPALASIAPAAFAVTCGATITSSVTLVADLPCPEDDGIVVDGGSGITIDLNGHEIRGNDSSGAYAGILITGGAKRIKVVNGSIYGFEYGIDASSSSSLRFENLVVRATLSGATGIHLDGLSGATVHNVVVLDPQALGSDGIHVQGNAGKTVVSNASISGFAHGMVFEDAVVGSAVTLANDVVVESGDTGIEYFDMPGTLTMTGTTIARAGNHGIQVECSQAFDYGPITIKANRAVDNDATGFVLTYCDRGKSVVEDNLATENGAGFTISDLPNSTIRNNRAASNGSTGMDIYEIGGATLSGNRADLNEGTGIYLNDSASDPQPAAVDDNFARGNGEQGFSVATDAVFPSSGNRAFGNASYDCGDNPGFDCIVHVDVATPGPVGCGHVISGSVTLTEDLACSAAFGSTRAITVESGASRVTIDLNGWRVDGKYVAILLSGSPNPVKNITVKNGVLGMPRGGLFTDTAIRVDGTGSSLTVENVLFETDEDFAVVGSSSGQSLTMRDVLYRNLDTGSSTTDAAVYASASSTVAVSRSVFDGGAYAIFGGSLTVDGIVVIPHTGDGYAESLYGGGLSGSTVQNSVFVGGSLSIGCTVGGTATVTGNLFLGGDETVSGLQFYCDGGTVANNTSLLQASNGFEFPFAGGVKITGNRAFGSLGWGFSIVDATSAVIKANFADHGNADDSGEGGGFSLTGSVRAISGNFARGNLSSGFDSADPVGGSGNVAFANSPNCTNVTCLYG